MLQDSLYASKYGNCFAFNLVEDLLSGTGIETSKFGPDSGLKVSLFLDVNEYLGITGQNVGAVLMLSNPGEDLPLESEPIPLAAGAVTFVSLEQKYVQREPLPYSNCSKTWPRSMKLSKRVQQNDYTYVNCRSICRDIQIVMACNCTTLLFPDISDFQGSDTVISYLFSSSHLKFFKLTAALRWLIEYQSTLATC